ncbi:MAG: DUF6242 domain-containing protein [Prevotella sp.]|nr:DUF6242 domain-containing protein [Prevotella sp.]
MKRYFLPFVALLVTLCSLSSCLSSDDDDETVYFDDTALTTFTLGTMNRYLHTTTSSGADSIYKTTFAGSTYKFYIDQAKREIYNPDSLPYGTDVAHVICTVSSKNAGQIAIQQMTSDSLTWYSSSDSIDFTQPRKFWVYSNSGRAYASYTVRVNVHQQVGDEFKWTLVNAGETNLASAQKLKLEAVGSHVLAFMLNNDRSATTVLDLKDMSSISSLALDAQAVDNVVKLGDNVLVMTGQSLVTIGTDTDGNLTLNTEENRNTTGIARLAGASEGEIYALGTDGKLKKSTDGCLTWTDETLADDAALLPTDYLSCIVTTLNSNADVDRITLTGTRPGEEQAEVWMKLVDKSSNDVDQSWSRIVPSERADYRLYAKQMLSVVPYDGNMIAFAYGSSAFAPMLLCKDGGINWRETSLYTLPASFNSTPVFGAATDGDNYIWMVCGGSGQVWRGRLNRLGWTTPQDVFTE